MKKVYVNLEFDRISGQQIMQKALKDRAIARGQFASKEEADILVYVQIPFDLNIVDEWKRYREQGKKIVFIHHYMDKSHFVRYAVFNIHHLLEQIDLHIIISRQSDLYPYLLEHGVKKETILVQELAAAQYDVIRKKYFTEFDEKTDEICFVGRCSKGLDDFVDFLRFTKIDGTVNILCPDPHKSSRDLSSYNVYTDKSYEGVYEVMSRTKFIYCPTTYRVPPFHLETTIQEAIPCGCIPIVDNEYRRILNTQHVDEYGFCEIPFDEKKIDGFLAQQRLLTFQRVHYLTLSDTLDLILWKVTNC